MRNFLGLLLVFFAATLSQADSRNRNVFPLGQKEALLANTGTALTKSLGAVYYNPGALAWFNSNQMGLFGSTYFYTEYTADAFMYADGSDIPFKSFSTDAKPTSYVASFKSGGYTLALSILVPGSYRLSNFQSWRTPNARLTIAQAYDAEEMWVGFSTAKKISRSCGAGLSTFFIKAKTLYQRFTRLSFPASPNVPIIEMVHVNTEVYDAAATAGILCEIDDSDIDVGFRIQSPTVRIDGKADILYSADAVIPVSHTELRDTNNSARYELPLDATLGVAMRPSKSMRVYFDVSAQAASDYDTMPGNRFNTKWSTQSALRYNLGADVRVSDSTSMLLGGAYNPSANQVVEKDGDEKSDFFEVTLGLQHSSGAMSFGVGAFYLWSTGERVINLTYDKGQTQAKIIGALLTTSYSY